MPKVFDFPQNNRLIAAFSSKADGNMSLSYGATADSLDNRKNFLEKFKIDYRSLVCAKQVHGVSVVYATQNDAGRGALDYESSIADCDGFITDQPNLPLAILTADCLPVFLYNPKIPAAGILHAGWRSSEANICSAGIKLMHDKFKNDPADLLAAFGPAIRSCCYEVSEDFKSNFPFAIFRRAGSRYMDLANLNRTQLINAGVREENIFDSALCTYCSKDAFFSFRKEAKAAGRMLSFVSLT